CRYYAIRRTREQGNEGAAGREFLCGLWHTRAIGRCAVLDHRPVLGGHPWRASARKIERGGHPTRQDYPRATTSKETLTRALRAAPTPVASECMPAGHEAATYARSRCAAARGGTTAACAAHCACSRRRANCAACSRSSAT